MLKRLVIASNNSHKTAEMVDYLAVLGVEAINYRDLHEQIAFPDETTDDMAQNARVKAQTIHEILPDKYILADDSALFVPAIPNHFGVTTMREFQAHQLRGDAEINAYVLAQLPDGADRTAYLQADFVVIAPSGKTYFSQARGGITLATEPRGGRNGLDELMVTENGMTLSEIDMPERVHYAHRGRAAIMILQQLKAAGEWQ
ncbi:non-canonical purine NTP pyrophosphatase [Weissella confusa]|uniref:non-canonical purine NTP pyrophosphatase n=1 Tax=Weissella confusa TaxID=1583 RepID=UPI0010806EB2|nr:non-canonical purine NTP pyrophosphatase [Weissella confusa]MBJ7652414.1 nucleoside triphosphatase [Weissella confusa]TGE42046.1 nucleoside triphosphatase [Weissella confusa]